MEHTEGKVKHVGLGVIDPVDEELNNGNSLCDTWEESNYPNAKRIAALWNAADGLTNEQAVKYLEHGAEMEKLLRVIKRHVPYENPPRRNLRGELEELLAKLEEG